MIYTVKAGDTLAGIAANHGTVQNMMANNIICNPNLLFIGQPILIPDSGFEYPKAGGYPYYVAQYGDSIGCLAPQFGQTQAEFAAANQLEGMNHIFEGNEELLVMFNVPNPVELRNSWLETADNAQCQLSPLQEHGIYFIGSFQWEALGDTAVPYLLPLIKHSCSTVRFYAVLSLGRIANGIGTRAALEEAAKDSEADVAELARIALNRYDHVQRYTRRLHYTTADQRLYAEANGQSSSIAVPKGTGVFSLRWNIPSSLNEEGPRGGLLLYDQVQLIYNGQAGYLPRVGYNETVLV
ncbi:LysM peptidoglycan-binding domain-containing protein [Paenibacillus solisilvae]|uniref:LysM peptidoglycan-binding domain-containing protein n=1 Tax=Paenibacillus solisilvae TaxID=2486751 RepID=A0ABW0VYM9_9BACL